MLYPPSHNQLCDGLYSLLRHQFGKSLGDLSDISEKLLDAGTVRTQIDPLKHVICYHFPDHPALKFPRTIFCTQEECILSTLSSQTFTYKYAPPPNDSPVSMRKEYDRADVKQLLESAKESRAQALESMRGLRESFEEVRRAYQESQSCYNRLVSDLRNSFQKPGLQKLADLCRRMDMVQSPPQELLAFKVELYNTAAAFGMEQFTAGSGEPYDSALYERISGVLLGDTVAHCILPGWRVDDDVYVRALVQTTDAVTPYKEEYQ